MFGIIFIKWVFLFKLFLPYALCGLKCKQKQASLPHPHATKASPHASTAALPSKNGLVQGKHEGIAMGHVASNSGYLPQQGHATGNGYATHANHHNMGQTSPGAPLPSPVGQLPASPHTTPSNSHLPEAQLNTPASEIPSQPIQSTPQTPGSNGHPHAPNHGTPDPSPLLNKLRTVGLSQCAICSQTFLESDTCIYLDQACHHANFAHHKHCFENELFDHVIQKFIKKGKLSKGARLHCNHKHEEILCIQRNGNALHEEQVKIVDITHASITYNGKNMDCRISYEARSISLDGVLVKPIETLEKVKKKVSNLKNKLKNKLRPRHRGVMMGRPMDMVDGISTPSGQQKIELLDEFLDQVSSLEPLSMAERGRILNYIEQNDTPLFYQDLYDEIKMQQHPIDWLAYCQAIAQRAENKGISDHINEEE